MIRTFAVSDGELLVPIADRLRYMQWFRAGATLLAALYWVFVPADRALPATTLGAVSLIYLGASTLSGRAWRLSRNVAVSAHSLMILLDAVYLSVVAYAPHEVLSPYRYVMIFHLMMVTLLASFRTGLKTATCHTLALWLDLQLREAGILAPVGLDTPGSSAYRRPCVCSSPSSGSPP